jgi:hypothetical protein
MVGVKKKLRYDADKIVKNFEVVLRSENPSAVSGWFGRLRVDFGGRAPPRISG